MAAQTVLSGAKGFDLDLDLDRSIKVEQILSRRANLSVPSVRG
jgi:hypothetical protein